MTAPTYDSTPPAYRDVHETTATRITSRRECGNCMPHVEPSIVKRSAGVTLTTPLRGIREELKNLTHNAADIANLRELHRCFVFPETFGQPPTRRDHRNSRKQARHHGRSARRHSVGIRLHKHVARGDVRGEVGCIQRACGD